MFESWNLVFNKVLKSFKESLDLSFLGFSSKVFLVLIVPVEDVLDLGFKSLPFGRNNGVAACSIVDFLLELFSSSLSSNLNIASKFCKFFLHGEGQIISLLAEFLLSDVAEFLNSFEHRCLEALSGHAFEVGSIFCSPCKSLEDGVNLVLEAFETIGGEALGIDGVSH